MQRIRAAFCILLLAGLLAAGGHFAVHRITDNIEQQLTDIRTLANDGDYEAAETQIDKLLLYYESRQHLLEFFIKRETVTAAAINLHGLSAYANEDSLFDLCSETDKASEQIGAMEHLFFSVF